VTFHPLVAVALGVSALLSGVGPIVLAVVIGRKTGASIKYFAFGAIVFLVSQIVLRLPWQIPLGIWIGPKVAGSTVLTALWIGASALTAALFEEFGRYFGYRFLVKDERSYRVGLMYGAGHGGVESMLLVGLSIVGSLVTYVLLGANVKIGLPPEALAKIEQQFAELGPLDALAGGVERVLSITFHIAMSLLVLQTFTRGGRRWLFYAVLLHFLSDSLGAGGAIALARRTHSALLAEIMIVPFAAVSLWIILRLRPRAPAGSAARAEPE
jgi:uncharacterized membrane protein YhfC